MGKTHVSLKHKTQSSTGALAPFSSAGSSCCSVCFIWHHPVVLQLTQVRSQIFFSCDNLAHIQLAIDPKRRRWEKSTERTILLLKAAKSHTWDVHGHVSNVITVNIQMLRMMQQWIPPDPVRLPGHITEAHEQRTQGIGWLLGGRWHGQYWKMAFRYNIWIAHKINYLPYW